MATIFDQPAQEYDKNYGFNVMPNAFGIPYEQDFEEGLYAYANMDKSPDMLKRARTTFGDKLVSRENAAIFVGDAVVRQLHFPDVTSAYLAYDIPLPSDIKDTYELSKHLGNAVLDKYSKQYDDKAALDAQIAKKATSQHELLLNNNLRLADMSPEDIDNFKKCFDYSPADVITAGKLMRADQKRSFKYKLGSAIALPATQMVQLATLFSDDANKLRKQADKLYEEAWADRDESYAHILKNASNPSQVLKIAEQALYEQRTNEIKDSTFFLRSINNLGEASTKLIEGSLDASSYINDSISAVSGLTPLNADTSLDTRQGQRAVASLADAKTAAHADYNAQNGTLGLVEDITRGVVDIAPYANVYTAIPSVVNLFTENAGRAFSTVASESGQIPDSVSNTEVYAKAAADAAINYATRAIGMKTAPLLMNRALTKMGVNSSLGHYIGSSTWTGFNFATVVPSMDAGLRTAYDAMFVKNPDLANGKKSLEEWWNKDIPSLRYWLVQGGIGSLMGASGTFAYHRSGNFLALKAELSGLTHQEADSLRRSTPLEDLTKAYQTAISSKLENSPQQALDTAIANTRSTISDEEARLVEENGHRATIDKAKQATLRFFGVSFAPSKDSATTTLLLGGHIDPATGKYIDGTKSVTLSTKDANLWIGSLFDARAAARTHFIREAYGIKTFLDASLKYLKGKVSYTAVLDPVSLDKISKDGAEAASKIKKIAKKLIENSKGEDGKPTLSESEAIKQAGETKKGNSTLAELVDFAEAVNKRIQQETATNQSHDPDASFVSDALVISKGRYDNNTMRRVFLISYGATTRNMIEEYAEQWMKDYIFEQRLDYTDLWRQLHTLNEYVKNDKISVTTLQNSKPELAAKLLDKNLPLTSDTIDNLDDARLIRMDIIEALSNLHLANLSKLAQDGKLPDEFTPLLDAKLHSDLLMEQDMVLAAALDLARSFGKFEDAAQRLFDASSQDILTRMQENNNPTVDSYYDTYVSRQLEYQSLMDNPMGLSADLVEATMAKHAEEAQKLAQQVKAQNDERDAEYINAVKTAQQDPANAGKSETEIIHDIETALVDNEDFNLQDNPASQLAEELGEKNDNNITDKDGLVCRQETIRIADLHLMPNFKTGSSEDTGEVEPLTGDYHPDHDPIRVMKRTDGSYMVFSGRHRLAHAKRYGLEKIVAYVYDETPEHNLAWARLKDIEWNIKDNQATAEDIALLIRGELIDGIPPLSDKQCKNMGIIGENGQPRNKTNAALGYQVGRYASQEVIDSFKNEQIDFNIAARLAYSAPGNSHVQNMGLRLILNNVGIKRTLFEMDIEKDKLAFFSQEGVGVQLDLFGEAEYDSTMDKFVKDHSSKRIAEINGINKELEKLLTVGTDSISKETRQKLGVFISQGMREHNKSSILNTIEQNKLEIEKWKHPYTNMAHLRADIESAFAQKYPEKWKEMQARRDAEQAALQAAEEAARQEELDQQSQTLGNSVQGDTSNIAEFNFSLTPRERAEQNLKDFRNDPTFGLGMLGTFEGIMLGRFTPSNDDLMDARLATMIKATERRMAEIDKIYDKDQPERLMAEMQAHFNQLTSMLPQGSRFGLEAYESIAAVYAFLRKSGDPDAAAAVHPVEEWQRIMANAFRNQFDRLLNNKLTAEEEALFFDRYSDGLLEIDLAPVKKDLNKTRRKYLAEVNKNFTKEERSGQDYRQARAAAKERAYQDVKNRHQQTFEEAYKKLATIRADKLMAKYFRRVILKLDQYRKKRIKNKIDRALYSITPRIQKAGKPLRGTVSMDTYNTCLDNYRLLNLTKSQIDSFEADNPDLADKDPDAQLTIKTYDHTGNPIELHVTKQQYETYASEESMSADALNEAAKALGTLIANGKEAWQLKAEAQRAQIEDFCKPIYDNYAETEDDKAKRLRLKRTKNLSGNSKLSGIKSFITGLYSDAQLIDVISSVKGLEHFKKIQDRIAEAHSYIETSEAQTRRDMTIAALRAIGINQADPMNLTHEQTIALAKFCDEKSKTITLDTPLQLEVQPPDFLQKQKDIFRTRFLRHLNFVRNKKNYDPNELVFTLETIKDNIPDDIYTEAMDLFGKEGDPTLYEGEVFTALENVFPTEKFGKLRNINQSIKEAADAQLQQWNKKQQENKNPQSFSLTEITQEEAAYKVLLTEQPDLADMLRQQGYTPQIIQKLKDIAGKQMMAYAYSLREQLNARLPLLRKVYEATYGTPFPEVQNYFRAFFDTSNQEQNAASSSDNIFAAGNLDSKSMRLFHTRVKHNKRIAPTMTVSEAFLVAMKQQSNILAYSDDATGIHLGEMLNKVLANKRGHSTLTDALDNAITSDYRKALEEQIQNMYRIYGDSDGFNSTANRAMSDLSTSQAFAILAWRMTSISKNFMAGFNTLGGSDKYSPLDWLKNIFTAFTGTGAINAKQMLQDPLIRDRFKGWDNEAYSQALLQSPNVKSIIGKGGIKLALRGLSAFGAFDRWWTNRSAVVAYNAAYSRAKKENPALPESALRLQARNAVKEALSVKGQPMDFRQRPLLATKNSWLTAPYFFLGGEAFNTFGDIMRLFAKTEFKHLLDRKDPQRAKLARRNLANLAAVWLINGFAYSAVNIGFAFLLDDEETWRKRSVFASLGLGTLIGPASGIPIISNFANNASRFLGINYYIPTPSYLPMSDIIRTIKEIGDIFDSDASAWDMSIGLTNAVRNILALTLLHQQRPTTKAGAAIKAASLAGTAAGNFADFILRAFRALDERVFSPVPEKPKKGESWSKQLRELNKIIRKQNADDNHPANLLTR